MLMAYVFLVFILVGDEAINGHLPIAPPGQALITINHEPRKDMQILHTSEGVYVVESSLLIADDL